MTVSTQPTTGTLAVPGGTIAYDVRGSGPLLLVIGQPMTAEPFGPLADQLASDRTVVTYDPRGLGRSTVHDAKAAVTPEVQADDLALLVRELGSGPADVVASSGGAVTGLALVARHPDVVGTVIAHEPPVADLLPDAVHVRAVVDGIEEAYREGGARAAFEKFVALVVHAGPVGPDGVPPVSRPSRGGDDDQPAPPAEPDAKQQRDDDLFYLRMLKPFTRYRPDVEALRSGTPRVVVAVGAESPGEVAARSARVLAERLGVEPTPFPGDHGGFMADPEAFARRVREVLDAP